MGNSIQLAEKFVPIIDKIYTQASKTAALDATTKLDFTGTNAVKVLKTSTTGLGDYSRTDGYPKGDVTAVWETMKLTEERAKEISVDRMDDEETLGLAFGTVMGEFVRNHVVPELDAYRFMTYATAAGNKEEAATDFTDGADLLSAIDAASAALDANEAPENRILYISSALKPLLMNSVSRQFGSEGAVSRVLTGYNDMPIVYVPQKRFYTGITLNDGTESWGYAKNGANINFLMLCPESVLQVTKMALPKIFSPDENQAKDAWKFQYRLYHDAMAYENKVGGIYVSKATK